MDQDKIGKFIRELRHEKNLSQYQLADMIPISRQAISKWERCESIPDSSTLLRLSEIFKVTINELLNGKRLKTNSIKDLENAALSIIDENNKRQRKIKRNFHISIIIITILLLSFLSYYFISSYNSTKVYTISGHNGSFKFNNGIFVIIKDKSYLKLGTLKYNKDIEVNNIKLYYLKKNKKRVIMEDKETDDYTIVDIGGYYEKLPKKDLKYILNSSYIEITYNNDQKEIIKLKYKRDYTNNSLFYKNKRKVKMKKANIKRLTEVSARVEIEEPKEEEPETYKQFTIVEDVSDIKEELSNVENPPTVTIHDSTINDDVSTIIEETNQLEIVSEEPENLKPTEETIDINTIIEKIKIISTYLDNCYFYVSEDESTMILYYEELNQITTFINDNFAWDYYIDEDRYNCSLEYEDDCKENMIKMLNEYFVLEGSN